MQSRLVGTTWFRGFGHQEDVPSPFTYRRESLNDLGPHIIGINQIALHTVNWVNNEQAQPMLLRAFLLPNLKVNVLLDLGQQLSQAPSRIGGVVEPKPATRTSSIAKSHFSFAVIFADRLIDQVKRTEVPAKCIKGVVQ
jgi:hypothetical protein